MRIENVPHQNATELIIVNSAGLKVVLTDFAASLYQVYFNDRPLMIAYGGVDEFVKANAYHGKTIAPICGRIKDADLFFEGIHYALDPNEGLNTLHSGPEGTAWRRFDYRFEDVEEGVKVIFSYDSPDMEGGFPGNKRFEVEYLIYENEPHIRLSFRTTSDEPTPVSVTNHGYWNLGGYRSIANHALFLKAHKVQSYDEELIPQGYVQASGPLDFSKPKLLKDALDDSSLIVHANRGIDHAFLFDPHTPDEAVLVYESPVVKMEVATSYPCAVLYGDNVDAPNIKLNNGAIHHIHMGLAIEPQYGANDYEAMTASPGSVKVETIDYRFYEKARN